MVIPLTAATVGMFMSWVIVVLGFMMGLVRWWLSREHTHMERRLVGLEAQLSKEEVRSLGLERELGRMQVMLPAEYVRREDWIRFTGIIESKLDRITEEVRRYGHRTDAT